jgi:hypothetical protein
MEEEFFPKWGMRMRNIFNGGAKSGRVSFGQSPSR